MSLVDLLAQTIHSYRLIPPGACVLVAVSGGADSLALLHGLWALHPHLGFSPVVATFDHGLRGAAGATDADFVAALAAQYGLPVVRGVADAGALEALIRIHGVEGGARAARYEFLSRAAHQAGADRVATGHHAGDQAETVLLHLLRGTGLRGLGGMNPLSAFPGDLALALIRPLLTATRAEIMRYCAQHHLTPRADVTNDDPAFLRNQIRHDVLPRLAAINPQIEAALNRLADNARTDDAFIESQLDAFIESAVARSAGRWHIDRDAFDRLHPALKRRCIARAAADLGGMIDHAHILAAIEADHKLSLPRGLTLRIEAGALWLEQADAPPLPIAGPTLPPDTTLALTVPGITRLPQSSWVLHLSDQPLPGAAALAIPPDATLTLRTRRPGDRFAPPGLGGHTQKLKQWLSDHKVPHPTRARLPLLVADDAIAAFQLDTRWIIDARRFPSASSSRIIYAIFIDLAR